MKLSEKVKTAMDTLGCNGKELAKATGLSAGTISRVVVGHYDESCSLDIYLPIKQALGLKGEESAVALSVQPIQPKPRLAKAEKRPRAEDVNLAQVFSRLAEIRESQIKSEAKIVALLSALMERIDGPVVRVNAGERAAA